MVLIGRRVAVIGAGVAGLATATALAMRGAQVTLHERAPALRTEGAGIQISPNGAAVLEALGVVPEALESQAVELRAYHSGRQVLRLDLSGRRWGRPFLLMSRAALIEALAIAAERVGVALVFGQAIAPEALSADLVVLAGGVHGPALPGAPRPKPFFTGQVAWRAVIPGDGVAVAQVFMGPGRHLVSYPLPGGRRNIVAVEERAAWAAEGWDHQDDPDHLRAAFAGFCAEVRGLLDQVEAAHLWGLFRHEVAAQWQDGRHALVGDAAHPALPFLAQGANMALEDAWVLADCLARGPQADALAAYQALRRPRVIRAVSAANANARNYHLRPPLSHVAHLALRLGGLIAPKAPLRRFDWLYGADVTALAPRVTPR